METTQQANKGPLTHKVTCTLPAFPTPDLDVGNRMFEFKVEKGGKKMGTLHISRGSIYWVPDGRQLSDIKSERKGIEWQDLADWFNEKNK